LEDSNQLTALVILSTEEARAIKANELTYPMTRKLSDIQILTNSLLKTRMVRCRRFPKAI